MKNRIISTMDKKELTIVLSMFVVAVLLVIGIVIVVL